MPLILPGASLPPKPGEKEPFTIKVGKIRGVESHGMLCSHEELGLDPEAIGHKKEEGLLILRADATVGQPFAEYLGRGGSDVVYDLEVTPNRPDLNSVIGIAREISALTGNALKLPEVRSQETGDRRQKGEEGKLEGGGGIDDLVAVRVEDAELCPRYTALVIKGVKVGPTPDWLRVTLEKAGIRSISNVVDVTNYVMLETGQPLHAFDYHSIGRGAEVEGLKSERVEADASAPTLQHFNASTLQQAPSLPTIVVRRAAAGEKFRNAGRAGADADGRDAADRGRAEGHRAGGDHGRGEHGDQRADDGRAD